MAGSALAAHVRGLRDLRIKKRARIAHHASSRQRQGLVERLEAQPRDLAGEIAAVSHRSKKNMDQRRRRQI